MKQIVVADLDGTLFDCEHRQHHVRGPGKKNWKAFFDEMHLDPVVDELNQVLMSLHQHYDIWFVSARPDNYRNKTLMSLYETAGWKVNDEDVRLVMRAAGDHRADTIVKQEILSKIRADGFNPLIWFDDRYSVVQTIREQGVLVAQVAMNDF